MSDTQRVLKEVEEERWRQDQKWGAQHDDGHTEDDWAGIIRNYLEEQPLETRDAFLKVAAIAVAAMEAGDRRAAKGASDGQGE